MPIFEYSCNSCGKEFETLVRGSSPAPECPACHGTGQIPPVAHAPIRRLPWSTEIACDGNHEEAEI